MIFYSNFSSENIFRLIASFLLLSSSLITAQNDQAIMTTLSKSDNHSLDVSAAIVFTETLPVRIETPPNTNDQMVEYFFASPSEDPRYRVHMEVLHPSILARFTNLTWINVWNVNMNRIAQNSFERCENLLWINLEEGSIKELPVGALRNCRRLTTLSLFRNRISSINPNALAPLTSLSAIQLGGNRLTSIDAAWFSALPNLNSFSIAGNPLKEIQPGILPTHLGSLFLNNCELTQLHPDLFRNFTNLVILSLSSNSITELPMGIFSDLALLSILQLSNTNIRRLNSNAFGTHPQIFWFAINFSGLYEIQPGFFDNFSGLQYFDTLGNRCADVILNNVHLMDFEKDRILHQCFANWFMPRP